MIRYLVSTHVLAASFFWLVSFAEGFHVSMSLDIFWIIWGSLLSYFPIFMIGSHSHYEAHMEKIS